MKALRRDRSSSASWFEELFDPSVDEWEPATVVLSPATVDALTRELNRLTPWHVRVAIASRKLGTGVMCESRFWGKSAQGAAGDARLEDHLRSSLLCVQSFMFQRTRRLWPSKERVSRDEYERDPMNVFGRLPLPGCAVGEESARLWYGRAERPVLELKPIPL
jgi:hypothetical protein